MRRAAKVDGNHSQIVAILRAHGARVVSMAAVGGGCPDLFVKYHGSWIPAEIKDGRKPPSARRLTPAQVKWHAQFGPVPILECPEDAVALLRRLAPPLGAKAVIYVPGDVEVDASDWERP